MSVNCMRDANCSDGFAEKNRNPGGQTEPDEHPAAAELKPALAV